MAKDSISILTLVDVDRIHRDLARLKLVLVWMDRFRFFRCKPVTWLIIKCATWFIFFTVKRSTNGRR